MDPTSLQLMQGASGGIGAVEFVATAQAQYVTVDAVVISKPLGTQNGDLMIAICTAAGNRTWGGDSGWQEVTDQGTAPSIRVAYKVDGGGEPSSYSFILGSPGNASGVIATFRRAAYATIGSISTTASSDVQTAPAITLSSSSSAILAFFSTGGSPRTWSNPTSGLVSTASDSDSINPSWALYRELNLSSGSTGSRSATASAAGTNVGCLLIGIKPA